MENSIIIQSCTDLPDELPLLQTLVFKDQFHLSLIAGCSSDSSTFFVTASNKRGTLTIISHGLRFSRSRLPIIIYDFSSLFHVRVRERGEPTITSRAKWQRLTSEIIQREPGPEPDDSSHN